MADTALKFGPEWLRALTEPQGGSGGVLYTPPLPNMKLADYRYGREEMLALFDKNVKPPEDLAQFGTLFVEKCQFPLNLMQMSEEESRAWQRGANSDASLRPYGPPGKRPPSPNSGRGRARGRGSVPYYDRNRSMDDDLDGVRRGLEGPSVERGFPRGPARNGLGFERQTSERGWFDRGDRQGVRDDELNGVISPRKGYTRAPFDDWRRGGDTSDPSQNNGGLSGSQSSNGQGEADGWRTSGTRRWGGAGAGLSQGQGWRSGGDRENNYARSKYGEGGSSSSSRPGADRWRRDGEDARGGGQRGGSSISRQRSRNDDHLPEWATDDPSEGGTFDNDGKFRADQLRNGVTRAEEWGSEENPRWEDEEVDPEDISENNKIKEDKDLKAQKKPIDSPTSIDQDKNVGQCEEDSIPSSWDSAPSPTPPPESREKSVDIVEESPSASLSDKVDNSNHLETLAGNLVSSLVDEDDAPDPTLSMSKDDSGVSASSRQEQPPPSSVPSPPAAATAISTTWSYLDPQGQIQGPFQSDEMLEWFSAGYFPADLMVRRSCDQRFTSLTDLTKIYSRVPFTPGPAPPPISDNQEEERLKQQQAVQQIQQHLMMQQQLLAQQHQQQMLAMQQQAAASGHSPDLNKLLQFGGHGHSQQQQQQQHHMGSLILGGGGHHTEQTRGYNSPDPLRNLLGSLGPSIPETTNDPLKQLLARNQSGPSMPGLGRPSHYSSNDLSPPNSHPIPQPVSTPSDPFQQQQSLFGLNKPLPTQHTSLPEQPPLNIPFNKQTSTSQQQNFDPIQSLLAQLAGSTSQPSSPQLLRGAPTSTVSQSENTSQFNNHRSPQSIWDMPTSEPNNPCPLPEKPLTSIWNDPLPTPPTVSEPQTETQEFCQEPTEDIDDLDQSESNSQEAEAEASETDPANFVKPKANEKKDKKSKRAEEKRKAKEAKKAAEIAAGPYIPGMSGTVKPEEQIVATGNIMDQKEEEKIREQQEAMQRQREQMEALAKLQEDQKARLEREEMIKIQQEKLAKLAPWAKKETSPVKEASQGMTLQEIQRMEAERERKERQQRDLQEARLREEQRKIEEEERARRAAKTVNWATAAQNGGKVKSLAEIQAEEARVEKERLERENAARSVRSKESASSNASSIWGGTKPNMSWAGKIAANTPTPPQARPNGNPWATSNGQTTANIVAPAGFWDPVVPEQPSPATQHQNKKNANKNKKKKAEEEQKVKQIFSDKKPKNDFDEWCSKALQGLQAQVDIPTFLGFLMDIESPFEVHDYVKSYVGEGKAQKKFATDYLERRSRWKNSLKGGAKYEDDLTTPANALTPGEGEFQFQEAGKKGKKTKPTKTNKSKQDISHLLGFSVTGQGVNRGELDMPQ